MLNEDEILLAKDIFEGLLSGDGSLVSRMASSHQFAVDPIDEIYGLRAVYDEVSKLIQQNLTEQAFAKIESFLNQIDE